MHGAVVDVIEWQFWISDIDGDDLIEVDAPDGASAWHAPTDVPMAVVVNTGLSWGSVEVVLDPEWVDSDAEWDEILEFSVSSIGGLAVTPMDGGAPALALTDGGGIHRIRLRIRGQAIGRENEDGGTDDGEPCEHYVFSVRPEDAILPGELVLASTNE